MIRSLTRIASGALLAASASAATTVSTYDDLDEGFYGQTTLYNGVTYHSVNGQPGMFPDGSTFDAKGVNSLGNEIIIEDASLLYSDFPGWGSPTNAMTFGTSFVNGPNLSLGALSNVTMDLAAPASAASVETVFYENGPWGGIVLHLQALSAGTVVASDSYTLSNLGGRDNIAFRSLSVSASSFDQLMLFATFGESYSGPRVMIDNLAITAVPAPGALALFAAAGLAGARRRRA